MFPFCAHNVLIFLRWAMRFVTIPCARHDPKILRLDDAKVVGDLIAENGPIAGDFFAQEAEGRVGELGASSVAFVVGDVSVPDAPLPLDRIEMRAIGWNEMQLDPATGCA